jgi:hypothetical protein
MHISDGGPEFCPLPSSFRGLLILEDESIGGFLLKGTPVCRSHKKWKGHIMKTKQHRLRGSRLTTPNNFVLIARAGSQQAEKPKRHPDSKSSSFVQ